MAYSLTSQRQLAPTVGLAAPEAQVRAEPAYGVIGDTVAIGRVLYAGNYPIVPNDEFWVPARENVTNLNIVPFGDIHIFIGYVPDQPIAMTTSPARTAFGPDTIAEVRSVPELPREISALDLKNSRTTQTALGQDITVED